MVEGTNYYAWARHKGQKLGYSPWSAARSFTIVKAYIAKPSIISPVDGSEIIISDGQLSIVSSTFNSIHIDDRHKNSDWGIFSDAVLQNAVTEALGSSDLTSHTFTNLSLDSGKTYYAGVRHNGASGLKSEFGHISFVAKNTVIASGGQKLWLNDTGDGVVIERTGKKGKETFVVGLAASRASALAWQNAQTDISALTNYTDFSGVVASGMTDAQINALAGYDANTAKININALVAAGSPAANHVRSKKIGGVACDMPNMNQLRAIFALKAAIDDLDHTVAANPSLALTSWDFGNSRVWSSTEYSANSAWYLPSDGNPSSKYATTYSKANQCGVIPIREM